MSVAAPAGFEYETVMVQEPPGGIGADLQVSVSEKALPAPLVNVSDAMVRSRLPVFVTVVVCGAEAATFMAPALTESFVSVNIVSDVDVPRAVHGDVRGVH